MIPEEYFSQRPKRGMEDDGTGGPMTPPTSPPRDTFSASEGEGEAVFAGKPIARSSSRKSSPRNEDSLDRKSQAKRQKISPEKQSSQTLTSAIESKAGGTMGSQKGSSHLHGKVEKQKDEKQVVAPPQPPPPPRRRHSQTAPPPPPPPPKGPPARKVAKPPPPPPPGGSQSIKKPPPPPTPGSTAPLKPPPPTKIIAPPPLSKQMQHVKRPQAGQEASPDLPKVNLPWQHVKRPQAGQEVSPDLQTADVKPNVNLPPGWMCVWSKSQKRWYFFNTKNNKSVWQWPPP